MKNSGSTCGRHVLHFNTYQREEMLPKNENGTIARSRHVWECRNVVFNRWTGGVEGYIAQPFLK